MATPKKYVLRVEVEIPADDIVEANDKALMNVRSIILGQAVVVNYLVQEKQQEVKK